MEFITTNHINTTGVISVNSGTLSVKNILGRNTSIQYISEGFNNDLTTTTITINFTATTTVSRIALMGINWKDFTVFYNGTTASTFSLTTTGATTSSDFSSNSETSMYMMAASVNCTSVSFDILSTQSANSEKAVGHIYLASQLLAFERNPSSKNYKPAINPKQIVHTLADGGTRTHTVNEKYSTRIKFKNVTTAFRNSLKTIFDLRSSFGFAAFPTMTAWDEVFYECVWPGSFISYQYSDDAAAAGHEVDMRLEEISNK